MTLRASLAVAAPRSRSVEASLDLLMSLFAVKPSVWLAQAVLCQLESLAGQAGQHGVDAGRSGNYRMLVPAWQGIVRRLSALEPAMEG